MENITISEYGYIGCDKVTTNSDKFIGKRDLEASLFKELYDYWLSNKTAQKIFTFENKECLKATSYVGIIQTKNLSIEILPKIYKGEDEENIRNIFIQMLKPLLNINEVQINEANLGVIQNKNIYEIFISLFIKHLDTLIHRGLKSEYISKEDNQFFLKGKLKFKEHIKQNYIHKERFYVEFDEYLQDRVENRLLKSTVKLLLKKTNDYENKRNLRQQLFIFDEVSLSSNYDIDISKINTHRGMEYYEMPLRFAKVFLQHKSFSSLRGNDNVFALLFPMETVFEKYMEFVLDNSKDDLGIKNIFVNGRKNEYFLTNGECKMARLEPDYLLEMINGKDIITDAKWKLLQSKEDENKNCDKVSISSGDIYQMFSYLHYYKNSRKTAYLFVPRTDDIKKMTLNYTNSKKRIRIVPIDLQRLISSNHKLEKNICKWNIKLRSDDRL